MVMRKILFLSLLAVAQHATAIESILLNEVSKLPVDFRTVKTCGTWKAEHKSGYYRLIVGDVYGGVGSEIYVQWITDTTQEKPSVILKTLTFPELNDDHSQYYFKFANCKKQGKFTYIKAKALYEHDQGNQVHDISIKLIDIGKYQISIDAR